MKSHGVTLIELIISVAIISILASIAIPLYSGYIREGHLATMRTDMNSLRTPIEDFRLENGSYAPGADLDTYIADVFDEVDGGRYTYDVVNESTSSYDVWGFFSDDVWVRCEDRFGNCCDSETAGATAHDAACP